MTSRLLTLVLVASLLTATPISAATPPEPGRSSRATYITLITGDRVRVTPRPGQEPQVVFEPALSGSAVTSFSGGHTYVVPSVAHADVVSGRLDSALFVVTTLLAERRDDASSRTLPVIVRYAGTPRDATAKAKRTTFHGAERSRVLASIGARAVMVEKTGIDDFWAALAPRAGARLAATIQRVSLDRRVDVSLDQSVPQIGGPAGWQRGLTGKGVKVAILDTGTDPTHPDLEGRIAQSENFSEAADAVDHHGHGTHVASIAAGTGAASGGKYKGVAPDATLLSGKVLDDRGSGTFSGVIAGMEWAAAQGAAVVNMSLGSGPTDGTDEVSMALNRLSRETGALFVVAAGNCYFSERSAVSSPAAADDAVAVGNLQRDGSLSETSCRGPRKGDAALKPEISAPGTDIVAARAAGTELGEPVDDRYTRLGGTSMATPHVAGTAALVAQAHPDWKAPRLKTRLISTADPQRARVDEEGAGRVDADQATAPTVAVDTGELELGTLLWPYPAKDEVSRRLTYHNPTGTPVTLQLAVSLEPAQATPKLSTDQLGVPAYGEATVTVTADRAAAGPGAFSGRVTATAAGADPIVTTIGWYTEPERYDLTVKGVGQDGKPADMGFNIARLDGDPVGLGPVLPMENGTATVRLPPGRYVVTSVSVSPVTDTTPERYDLVVGDEVRLPRSSTVTLDARKARPVEIVAQGKSGLIASDRTMSYLLKNSEGVVTGGFLVDLSGRYIAATIGATPSRMVTTGSSEFVLGARRMVPPYQAKVRGGDAFSVLDFFTGPRFTGTRNLALYDAGAATPGELRDVAGKLALIRRNDTETRANSELVEAAQTAGAAGALIYNPDRPGVDGVDGVDGVWASRDTPDVTIPAMRTSRVAARMLLDRLKARPVTVRVTGQAVTPYLYDLMQPWPGRVPAVGTVRVEQSQLARIDDEFGAHTTGMWVFAPRGGHMPGAPAGADFVGRSLSLEAPGRVVSYVLANQTIWESAAAYGSGDRQEFSATSLPKTYRPGERHSMPWLAPVHNSGLPAAEIPYLGVRRSEGGLLVQMVPFQNRREYSDIFAGGPSELILERNGEQVATAPDTGLWVDVPGDAAEYRAVLDTGRDSEFWKYSTRVKTAWTWKSRGAADEVMPVVLADIDVPQADALSRVRTGVPVTITVGLRHQVRSQSRAGFTTAKLELSYDGAHWTELDLTRTADGQYYSTVNHPHTQAGNAPSLRLTATDANGNKIEQQVTNAYGLGH